MKTLSEHKCQIFTQVFCLAVSHFCQIRWASYKLHIANWNILLLLVCYYINYYSSIFFYRCDVVVIALILWSDNHGFDSLSGVALCRSFTHSLASVAKLHKWEPACWEVNRHTVWHIFHMSFVLQLRLVSLDSAPRNRRYVPSRLTLHFSLVCSLLFIWSGPPRFLTEGHRSMTKSGLACAYCVQLCTFIELYCGVYFSVSFDFLLVR